MFIFTNLIIGPNFKNDFMVSEQNSVSMAQAGLLWVLSIVFLLIGITRLSKKV